MYNFLKGSMIGMTFMTGYQITLPEPSSYDRVTFYSGDTDGCIIDKVHGLNRKLTTQEIDEESNIYFQPEWTVDTYLLCEFDHNFSGGNVINIVDPITNWIIYRSEENSDILTQIDTIDVSQEQYIDFTALKNKTYRYHLFGKNDTEISAPISTNKITSDYHGWFLIDIENKISYMFDLNFTGGVINQAENITEYETNLPYNAYSKGATNYIEGNISALVMDDYCEMKQSVDMLDRLREFIFSDRPKYLKDNKGRIFRVFTSGYRDTILSNGITGEPRYVSFDFKEVGEV